MNAVAIILASGSGQRFGANDIPKHLTPILEVPILAWTLNVAIESKVFSAISVVTSENDIFKTKETLQEYFKNSLSSITVTKGASERTQSFLLGLESLRKINLVNEDTVISLLDANRPFITTSQIEDLYTSALKFGCSCPARPVVNGIAKISLGHILDVPDKSSYVEFVTPEFIQYKILKKALSNSKEFLSLVEYALDSNINPKTIDAGLLSSKLTYPEDTSYLEGIVIKNNLCKPLKYNYES